jgi:hypothetical protein
VTEQEKGVEGEGANICFECGLRTSHKYIHICDKYEM